MRGHSFRGKTRAKGENSFFVPESVMHMKRQLAVDRYEYCLHVAAAVKALVAEVRIEGEVLEMCGGRDAAAVLLLGAICTTAVATNDARIR